METNSTFKTKTGYCHILPDKIVLSVDGDIEKALNATSEKHNPKALKSIFALIIIFLLGSVYYQYRNLQIDLGTVIFIVVFSLILYFILLKMLSYPSVHQIDRSKISKIKLFKSHGGLTYSKFIVYFESENKKKMATDITLPDPNIFGKKYLDDAVKILTDEKLLDTEK